MSPLTRNKILRSPEEVARLAERLSECIEVTRFNTPEHTEARALAETFGDLESMFRDFLEDELPRLTQAQGRDLAGLLIEVGVDFQHILYHIIEHQKFYLYLVPEGTKVFGGSNEHD